MTAQAIHESGMTFGPYPAGQCFPIEVSGIYRHIQEGVKMAEFVLLRQQSQGPALWIVEAKSSSPHPETQPRFDEFINDICHKFTNALILTVAARLLRHPDAENELPDSFKTLDLASLPFRLILVINGCQERWLGPLNDALSKAMKPIVKTWGQSKCSVIVLNDEMAQQHHLIQKSVK
ncbi:MAG: hypothetical protein H7831_05675 [Magnetococcus sp. WYHC-3]